jgi:DNA (cytosine-5)-methyltransferase 3A
MKKDCLYVISEQLSCNPVFIDSSDFSAQQRPRYYWTNIDHDSTFCTSDQVISDILENDVDSKFWYDVDFDYLGDGKSVQALLRIKGHDILKRVHNKNFKCHTLTTCGGGNTQKKVYIDGRCRKLTPTEYERLQTVPDNYTEGVSNTQRYNMLGNGWTVDVIAHILKGLKNSVIQ